jgi:glycosyl transferase family 25
MKPVYIINLKKNTEKYHRCTDTLKLIGIEEAQRFEAIVGKDLDRSYIKNICDPQVLYTLENGRKLDKEISTLGAIGCSLSHIALWEKMISDNISYMYIVEDDAKVVLAKKDDDIIEKLLQSLPDDWDIFYLGCKSVESNEKMMPGGKVIKMNGVYFGSHAYVINQKGAKKLLEKCLPISCQVDSYMSYMNKYYGLNAYRPVDNLVVQYNPEGSSIQDLCVPCFINRHYTYISKMSIILFILLLAYFFKHFLF